MWKVTTVKAAPLEERVSLRKVVLFLVNWGGHDTQNVLTQKNFFHEVSKIMLTTVWKASNTKTRHFPKMVSSPTKAIF